MLSRVRAAWAWFGAFRRTRPFWGGVWLVAGVDRPQVLPQLAPVDREHGLRGIAGYLVGGGMILCGLIPMALPAQRYTFGLIGAILAVVSLVVSNLGGFLLGMALGVLGGSMMVGWGAKRPRRRAVEGEDPAGWDPAAGPRREHRPGARRRHRRLVGAAGQRRGAPAAVQPLGVPFLPSPDPLRVTIDSMVAVSLSVDKDVTIRLSDGTTRTTNKYTFTKLKIRSHMKVVQKANGHTVTIDVPDEGSLGGYDSAGKPETTTMWGTSATSASASSSRSAGCRASSTSSAPSSR